MSDSDRDLLAEVGRALREQDEWLVDALTRWGNGELSGAELDRLHALASRDPDVAAMMHACRPDATAGSAERVIRTLTTSAAKEGAANGREAAVRLSAAPIVNLDAERSRRRQRQWWAGAAVLAAAAGLALLLWRPTAAPTGASLPAYGLELRAQQTELRSGGDQATEPASIRPTDRLEFVLRPEHAYDGLVRGAVYGVPDGAAAVGAAAGDPSTPRRIADLAPRGSSGVLEGSAPASALRGHSSWTLRVVVAAAADWSDGSAERAARGQGEDGFSVTTRRVRIELP